MINNPGKKNVSGMFFRKVAMLYAWYDYITIFRFISERFVICIHWATSAVAVPH